MDFLSGSVCPEEPKLDLEEVASENNFEDMKGRYRKSRSSEKHLTREKELQAVAEQLRCLECDYSTSDRSSLYLHIRGHTDDRPFKCQYCPYASRTESILTIHTESHILDLDAPLNNLQSLSIEQPKEKPVPSEPDTDKLRCNEFAMNEQLKGKDATFNNHASTAGITKSLPNAGRTEIWEAKKFRCVNAGCTYSTNASTSFKNHLCIHSNEKAFQCKICLKSFRRADHCHSHERLHVKKIQRHCKHKIGASCTTCKEPLTKLFKCLWCPFICEQESQLVIHCRSSHKYKRNHGATQEEIVPQVPEVQMKCEDFNELVKQNAERPSQSVGIFLNANFDEFPVATEAPVTNSIFIAESCSVSSETNLVTEVIPSDMSDGLSLSVANEVSSFTTVYTSECSVEPATKEPSHETTSRKFKCNRSGCTFSSAYSKNLILHRMSHLMNKTKKPFQYRQRKKRVVQPCGVKLHEEMEIKKPEKQFQCKECPKGFTRPKALKLHEIFHTQGYLHRCEECDFGTQYEGFLRKHINAKHQGKRW